MVGRRGRADDHTSVLSKGFLASILPEARFEGIVSVSRHYAEATPFEHFAWGIPACFLIAALVWILPRMESGGEGLMIVIVTCVIGLGGMSDVVAGSTELFSLVGLGELGVGPAVFGGILPALAGNVLGGTGIFAALTCARVREEICMRCLGPTFLRLM